ncbi:hypothetical protein PSYPI_48078, partial [Pseudomonas syringae pv. pisi str. 1704B]
QHQQFVAPFGVGGQGQEEEAGAIGKYSSPEQSPSRASS